MKIPTVVREERIIQVEGEDEQSPNRNNDKKDAKHLGTTIGVRTTTTFCGGFTGSLMPIRKVVQRNWSAQQKVSGRKLNKI